MPQMRNERGMGMNPKHVYKEPRNVPTYNLYYTITDYLPLAVELSLAIRNDLSFDEVALSVGRRMGPDGITEVASSLLSSSIIRFILE
jgi:hypothetical protein